MEQRDATLPETTVLAYMEIIEPSPSGNDEEVTTVGKIQRVQASETLASLDRDILGCMLEGDPSQDPSPGGTALLNNVAPTASDLVHLNDDIAFHLIKTIPLPEHAPDPDNGRHPVIKISRRDLANLLVASNRVDEFPESRDALLSLAETDIVDRYRADTARTIMDDYDPPLTTNDGPSSPTP